MTYNSLTVDEYGRATAGTNTSIAGTAPITVTTASGVTTIALAASRVTAGTYNSVTVDTMGRVTAGSTAAISHTRDACTCYLTANYSLPAGTYQPITGGTITTLTTTGNSGTFINDTSTAQCIRVTVAGTYLITQYQS